MVEILEQRTFAVKGMTCSSCVNTIEKSLNSIDGVKASVNFASETVHVVAPPDISNSTLIKKIKSSGYEAALVDSTNAPALHSKKSARALIFALLLAIPAIAISMAMSLHMYIDELVLRILDNCNLPYPLHSPAAWVVIGLTTPLIFLVAWPIHRAAFRNFFHPTMDSLISLGSFSAFGWSIYSNSTGEGEVYTEVAAGVLLFVILGRYLESRAKRSAGSALSALLALGSDEVSVIRGGITVLIPISHLEIGDEFIVNPGSRIATDGLVVSGNSSVDNSLLTGESAPVEVSPGSSVIGAALNNNGRIIVRATRVGSDTEFARITSMVIQAQGNKAPIQRTADKISSIFVPIVTALSIATFFAWRFYGGENGTGHSLSTSISVAITVLVIACPCALGLATPVALLVASGRGARRGILLRQPRALELARKVNVIVLDKTGTLTTGLPTVQLVTIPKSAQEPLSLSTSQSIDEKLILSAALTLELANDHPIARAIVAYARAHGASELSLSDFTQTPGSGVAGRIKLPNSSPVILIGNPQAIAHSTTSFNPEIAVAISQAEAGALSVSVLAWDGVALAVFATGDQIKFDAASTIEALKKAHIEPWLITGDTDESARVTAAQVGIDSTHVISRALPEEKLAKIKELQAAGKVILMAGDGVNDAAALAAADLSMAMGTGTDTAIGAADITLMRPELSAIVEALALSKKTLRIIKANLGWAFAYNVIGIPIAAFGLMSPMYAAGAMALSSLFVVSNSLRLK